MCRESRSPIEEGLTEAWRQARRIAVFVVGSSIVLIGLALVVLPGPAIVVIPVGLAILATEFVWARRLLRRARKEGGQFIRNMMGGRPESHDQPDRTKAESGGTHDDEHDR